MVPADADRSDVNRRLNLAVRGRCCPIVVVDTVDGVIESAAAIHELTHQIELFDAVFSPGNQSFEWSLYATAAAEGNAERIRGEYLESLGVAPQRWEKSAPPSDGVPVKLNDAFDFPYSYGARFMKEVDETGGEAAIDAALAEPPVSAKQVMFPEAYFAREEPVTIERPEPTAGAVVDRAGTLGVFLLYLTIRDAVGNEVAESIVADWLGDSYVVSSSTDQTCLDMTVLMGTPSQATAVSDALSASPPDGARFEVALDDDRIDAVRCLIAEA